MSSTSQSLNIFFVVMLIEALHFTCITLFHPSLKCGIILLQYRVKLAYRTENTNKKQLNSIRILISHDIIIGYQHSWKAPFSFLGGVDHGYNDLVTWQSCCNAYMTLYVLCWHEILELRKTEHTSPRQLPRKKFQK